MALCLSALLSSALLLPPSATPVSYVGRTLGVEIKASALPHDEHGCALVARVQLSGVLLLGRGVDGYARISSVGVVTPSPDLRQQLRRQGVQVLHVADAGDAGDAVPEAVLVKVSVSVLGTMTVRLQRQRHEWAPTTHHTER
jgi:hypothetical protein